MRFYNPLGRGNRHYIGELRPRSLGRAGERATKTMETSSIREEALGAVETHQLSFQESTEKKRKGSLSRAYQSFFTLPVPVVLTVMWLAGAALMSVCGVALYLLWLSLQALAMG